jgi:hypothetical protein
LHEPHPRQTGIHGRPTEPFIVSAGVVGPHDDGGPDLGPVVEHVRARLEDIKQHHRAQGWLKWDQWALLRVTPDGRQRNWVFDEGVVDESVWRESVDGVPDRYDSIVLSSGSWGQLQYAVPSHMFLGSSVRSLAGWVRAPVEDVGDAANGLLDELVAALATPGVTTGYVHIDSIADPYTEIVTAQSRLSDDRFDAEVHGYYWAVGLTAGHVERLGGTESVRRSAPCERIDTVRGAAGAGATLLAVLTESPSDLDPDRVLAWRRFLSPVLRRGYPIGLEDIGTGPLKRPLWLFEGDPVPRRTPFVLRHGHPSTASVAVVIGDTVEDPERPLCWLYPGPSFDRERDHGRVAAVVNAWFVTGSVGLLSGVDGELASVTGVTWDSDERGLEALVWQFDPGTCDPVAAVTALAAALGDAIPSLEVLRVG